MHTIELANGGDATLLQLGESVGIFNNYHQFWHSESEKRRIILLSPESVQLIPGIELGPHAVAETAGFNAFRATVRVWGGVGYI